MTAKISGRVHVSLLCAWVAVAGLSAPAMAQVLSVTEVLDHGNSDPSVLPKGRFSVPTVLFGPGPSPVNDGGLEPRSDREGAAAAPIVLPARLDRLAGEAFDLWLPPSPDRLLPGAQRAVPDRGVDRAPQVEPIPEPGTAGLLWLGFLLCRPRAAGFARRRRGVR